MSEKELFSKSAQSQCRGSGISLLSPFSLQNKVKCDWVSLPENVVFVLMISGAQCSWNLGRGSEAEIIVELVFRSE